MRKHPPSAADQADALSLDSAVESMIEGPLSEWNNSRPISSLNRDDLRRLAFSAICGWILKRAELAACGDEQIAEELNSAVLFVG